MARLLGREDAHQCLHDVLEVGRDTMRENPEQDSGGMGQPEGGSEVRSVLVSSVLCPLLS